MNKMREQFESIVKHHYWLRDIDCSWDEDCYSGPEWQLAWEMWKASRENLVIELPFVPRTFHAGTEWIKQDAKDEYRNSCVNIIQKLGVKVE